MILKIDLPLITNKDVIPEPTEERRIESIMFNMYGMQKVETFHLKFMADAFQKYENVSRYLVNIEDNVKEELKVFCKVHDVRIAK